MAVTLFPIPHIARLRVSGDIVAELAIPAEPPESFAGDKLVRSYYIALSDGSLIRALLDDDPGFTVVIEGAGVINVGGSGRMLSVAADIEWITLGANWMSTAAAQKAACHLPLFQVDTPPLAA